MAIMTCPKCGGCGSIVKYEEPGFTITGGNMPQTCMSCGGTGYVTDGVAEPVRCLKCEKDMVIQWKCSDCQIAELI